MSTYRLRCLGGEEPWTVFEADDAKTSVRNVLLQWGEEELKHELGYGSGEGDAHCDDHEHLNSECEACADAEYERFNVVLTNVVDSILDEVWLQLQSVGYTEVRKGGERIWFSMSIDHNA